eukprot:CAMPEP_0113665276 /NCGR_PEP_ID=MMETSP0038_2-20120614/2214_1 /TAXON_ID=2898 /ORGANISM="Cryptomonas paramecium" /LENGTH=265 /DNA_ID=CAMNT_0000580609 /DNA_START=181 /DNA_END=975 /DNA_ORIENTATION=+ /assembly_acc=CAM_ASM_000170
MGEACDELVSSIHMDIDKCKIGPAAHPQSPPCSPRSCGANHRTVAPDPGDSVSSWRNFFDHDSTLETDDQIIIYGNSKTSWRTAASVAHFVGDTCMSLARRGRLSALSAVGLYFIAVRYTVFVFSMNVPFQPTCSFLYEAEWSALLGSSLNGILFQVNLCVIVTIHTGLFAASFAGSSVLWILGSSVYVRLVALAAGIGGCLVAPTREGSRMSDVQEAVRQALINTLLVGLTAIQVGVARAARTLVAALACLLAPDTSRRTCSPA